ncbi:MAG: TonB-dependent receptor [candidate division KSB1 bacterium]|nr:TonB-dependent receptor [candidate division KSB1 bacterium]
MIGYKIVTKTNVLVQVNRTSNVPFNLEPSVIEGEEVTVVAERDILHKEVSYSQEVMTSDQIIETASIRTLKDFITKQAGVAENLGIRGGDPAQTGTILNGITFVNKRHGTPTVNIPLSSIEQVSVVKGGFNAEYGNFRSGMMEITTKSGSRQTYSGRLDMSMNNPHMKRFGKSLYDYTNYELRADLDPDVAFVGNEEAWGDNDYLKGQYRPFVGWNTLATLFNRSNSYDIEAQPIDLYLWDAWMHMIDPPWDKLAEQGYEVSDEIKKKFADHAHPREGGHSDWNIDFGFGGPVPFIGDPLGNATFYLSHNSSQKYYTVPNTKDSQLESTTMLTLKSDLSKSLKLELNGLYRFQDGMIEALKGNQAPDGMGQMQPVNNIIDNTAGESQYLYQPVNFSPMKTYTTLVSAKLTKTLSARTFWDVTLSRESRRYRATPSWANKISIDEWWDITGQEFLEKYSDRTPGAIAEFGPIKVNEMPYHFSTGRYELDGFDYSGNYEQPFGVTHHRFAQVGQAWMDSSNVQTFRGKFNLASQLTPHHFIKTGIELEYSNVENELVSHWYGHSGGHHTLFWNRNPLFGGAYIQDQITFEGVVTNIGLRADYYDPSGRWPEANMFDEDVWGTHGSNTEEEAKREINAFDVWDSLGVLKDVETKFILSPRLGMSFPVTDKSKFYFNYGHFRQLVPWKNLYITEARPLRIGLIEVGDPNMDPPRTISYETGVEYEMAEQYLIRISGFYKDVTGEQGQVNIQNAAGSVDYDKYYNNNYEDILGLELSISKNVGRWFTGWANFDFTFRKSGYTGKQAFYQDPSKNEQFSLYEGAESTFLPEPGFRANLSVHSPSDFGPRLIGIHPLGQLRMSMLPVFQSGRHFTWNPLGELFASKNLQWPNYWEMDVRFSKRLKIGSLSFEAYLNINNIFNAKRPLFHRGYAFTSDADYQDYLASLHLPMYDSEEYDVLRENSPDGYYVAGDDKPGDLRSNDKPYINDPNSQLWLFDNPRDIWFGIEVYF